MEQYIYHYPKLVEVSGIEPHSFEILEADNDGHSEPSTSTSTPKDGHHHDLIQELNELLRSLLDKQDTDPGHSKCTTYAQQDLPDDILVIVRAIDIWPRLPKDLKISILQILGK